MTDDLAKRFRNSTEMFHCDPTQSKVNIGPINDPIYIGEAHDIQIKPLRGRIEELEVKLSKTEGLLAKAVDALDEAVYLLAPDEKDMMRQAGVYRIVTTLAELKGQDDD